MTYITHEIEVAYEALYADEELIESVVLKVGDKEHYLTLDEAYKLGKILRFPDSNSIVYPENNKT